MAIYRGSGGSVEGILEADILTIAISQGGTGASTAAGARTNLGLGTAATTASSDYATAAQGALADSAVQPADLGAVATSNSYNDLDDLPTLGTASAQDVGYFATAAQGALADTATQPEDLATVATSGSYNDLTDKPTVPTNLDSLTDVVITSATTNETLQFNGTNWVNAAAGSGTVTSVSGTGTVNGLSLSGTVTSSGSLTLGGTLDLSSPPAIGGTTPAAGSFSTLKVGSSSIAGNSNADITLGLTVRNSGASTGYLQTYNSNASTDLKTWRLGGNSSGSFVFETVNDAYSSSANKMTLDTSGNLTATTFNGTVDGGTY